MNELCNAIDDGSVSFSDETKELSRKLVENFNWDKEESKKVWSFGPD